MPGEEEAEVPVPGGAGVQQGESHLRPAGGAGDGKETDSVTLKSQVSLLSIFV